MGDRDRNFRIYMEDYVHTFIRKSLATGGEELAVGLLLGGTVELDGGEPCFIPGALDAPAAIRNGGEIFLNENVWDELQKRKEKYFPRLDICGWYVRGGEDELPDIRQLNELHQKWFPAYGSVLYVSSGNDGYFMVGGGAGLVPVRGYYVYYERNLEMQDYMILVRRGVGSEQESHSVAADAGIAQKNEAEDSTKIAGSFRTRMQAKKLSQGAVPAVLRTAFHGEGKPDIREPSGGAEAEETISQSETNRDKRNRSHGVIDARTKKEETADITVNVNTPEKKPEEEKEEHLLSGVYRFGLGLVAVLAIVFAVSVTGNGGVSGLLERFAVQVGQNGNSESDRQQSGDGDSTQNMNQAENVDASASLEGETERQPISITIIPGNVEPLTEDSSGAEKETQAESQSREESLPVDATESTEETSDPAPSETPGETESAEVTPEPTQPPESESPQETEAVDVQPVYEEHLVLSGETLLGICIDRYGNGSRMEEICKINGIDDRDYIYEGQLILLP